MSPTTRVTRHSLAAVEDFASLTSRDRLIFAQAIYEYGARQAAWGEIAKLLSKHPLISRPKNFFTVQSCVAIYNHLMKEAEIERTDLCEAKKSPLNAQLAQRFYRDRVTELRDEIASEEERFKTVVAEIEEIRAGKWDDKILVKLNGAEAALDLPPTLPINPSEPTEPEHVDGDAAAELAPETVEEAQVQTEPAVQVPESEGEVSMDVSSPMHPSSPPPPEPSPQEEVLKPAEDQAMEPSSTESELSPLPPSPEKEPPSSPIHVPKTRSQTRREQSEPEETPAAEVADVEMAPVEEETQEAEVQKEEAEETTDVIPDEPTPATKEEEPVEFVSQESTPAPQERKGGKRRASDVDMMETAREKKRIRDKSEPIESAESPAPATPSAIASGMAPKDAKERKRFQSVILMLHSQINAHRNGTIFHHPIKPSEAPDYHDIVKRPMDLKTIKNRVKDGRISTSSEYQRDIYLMFANSLMYNRPNSDIYMMAEEMMLDSEAEIQNFQQTEAYNLRTRG